MMNVQNPPLAVALGRVAPKAAAKPSAKPGVQALPQRLPGLGLADIAAASARASAANGLTPRRQPQGDPIR